MVESGLGIRQALTVDHGTAFDQMRCWRIGILIQDFCARRWPTGQGVFNRHFAGDQVKSQLCRLPNQPLQALRVIETRNLDENSVGPLPLHDGLCRTKLVNTAADHLDRLSDRSRQRVGQALLCEACLQDVLPGLLDLHLDHGSLPEQSTGHRLGQGFERFDRALHHFRIANGDIDRGAGLPAEPVTDLLLAQAAADIVLQRLQFFGPHCRFIDLHEDVRTTLQIEPQRHGVVGKPVWQAIAYRLRHQVWRGVGETCQDHGDDREDLPAREIEHEEPVRNPLIVWPEKSLRIAALLGRLALDPDLGDQRAHHPHLCVLGDLDLQFVVVDNLGNLADNAAAGDDRVVAPDRGKHRLTRLHLLALRANDKEIHNDEYQDNRQNIQHHAGAAATSGLGISRSYKHMEILPGKIRCRLRRIAKPHQVWRGI